MLTGPGGSCGRVSHLGAEVIIPAVSPDVTAATVEYRIVRNGLVREVERGKVLRTDVCDAHPELLRAARNVGRPTRSLPHLSTRAGW